MRRRSSPRMRSCRNSNPRLRHWVALWQTGPSNQPVSELQPMLAQCVTATRIMKKCSWLFQQKWLSWGDLGGGEKCLKRSRLYFDQLNTLLGSVATSRYVNTQLLVTTCQPPLFVYNFESRSSELSHLGNPRIFDQFASCKQSMAVLVHILISLTRLIWWGHNPIILKFFSCCCYCCCCFLFCYGR